MTNHAPEVDLRRRNFRYQSGEEIKARDQITYHGESGEVEFVVVEKTGEAAMDWYLNQYPGGGIMLNVNNLGNVFLSEIEKDEDLKFISRGRESV
jgi:hypothetical protein